MYKTKAKVQVKNDAGKVILSQEYDKVVFEGTHADDKGKATFDASQPDAVKGLLGNAIAFFQAQVGEKGNGVVELLKNATYAYDLGERAKIRQQLVSGAEGPEKSIEKQVKEFMAARARMGKPVTEEVARKRVMAMLEEE